MWTICFREFRELMSGFRPLLIAAVLFVVSYYTAQAAELIPDGMGNLSQEEAYVAGMRAALYVFGYLFVFTLSHNVVNKELEARTIRFLVTKASRSAIIYGKTLGTFLFWALLLLLNTILISYTAGTFYLIDYLEFLIFIFYGVSAAVLLSILIPRSAYTMFFGVIAAFALPALSFWSMLSEEWYITWVKFVTPYYYFQFDLFYMAVPFVIGLLFYSAADRLFQRRDV
ncbi:ABC transporter permease subunit [Bacillus daqingensis]|uniref:ABC transporter permease subunit n=1 Tax=Bacillus daqingensis TaxID=872396 RepID=A0ABV9NUL7_9BACI